MANIITRWLAKRTSLQDAVRSGKLGSVRAKLEGGAALDDINDCMGYAQHEGLAMVQVLVEHGADVNHQPSGKRRPPLHLAAASGYAEIAAYLIARGAQVNAVDSEGDTPLDCAFLRPFDQALLELRGAATTPDDSSRAQRQRRVAELLVKHGARGGHALPSHHWGAIKSRVRPLVLAARANFPSAPPDVIAAKVMEKFDFQYEQGTPPERKAQIQKDLRELVLRAQDD